MIISNPAEPISGTLAVQSRGSLPHRDPYPVCSVLQVVSGTAYPAEYMVDTGWQDCEDLALNSYISILFAKHS